MKAEQQGESDALEAENKALREALERIAESLDNDDPNDMDWWNSHEIAKAALQPDKDSEEGIKISQT